MKKEKAIKIICSSAKIYSKKLTGKKFLFIFKENNNLNSIEVIFGKSNFLHLTGIKTNLRPLVFFEACLNSKLSIKDFTFREGGITKLKLDVLESLMNLPHIAKMVGDFDSYRLKLSSEKIMGNIIACMGFVKNGNFYYPNTCLKENIKYLSSNTSKIIAVFSKNYNEKHYNNQINISKNTDLSEIKKYLVNKKSV